MIFERRRCGKLRLTSAGEAEPNMASNTPRPIPAWRTLQFLAALAVSPLLTQNSRQPMHDVDCELPVIAAGNVHAHRSILLSC